MAFATTTTVALEGAVGHLIEVQADVSRGVVGTTLVGRPDASLQEARERCRMALNNGCQQAWPTTRRVTIGLSPADIPKRGTHYDLSIAVAVLSATERIPPAALQDTLFLGELTLAGGLRAVPGVLPMVLAAADRGLRRVFVPEPQAGEATLVPGLEVYGVRSLAQVGAILTGYPVPEAPPVAEMSGSRLLSWRGEDRCDELDLADVQGVHDARFAVEVACAGGHHLMLSGPKGAGKTTLAERIPSLLPDLDDEEALELGAVHSLVGAWETGDALRRRPPYSAPHHTATRASILGGGSGRVRPGEVSRAHAGVLLLDEFPLFASDVVEALREPLENGEVTIARGEEQARFPARGMVVLACNPCPCGEYYPRAGDSRCDCPETARRAYRRKLSGPITDRVDVVRHLRPLSPAEADDPLARSEDSATVRARVALARERQAARYAGCGWRLNAHAPGAELGERWPLSNDAAERLADEMYAGRLTRRGATRVHRLAWSVADLAGVERPGAEELGTALALRYGDPVPARVTEAGGRAPVSGEPVR